MPHLQAKQSQPTRSLTAWLSMLVFLASACGDRRPAYDEQLQWAGPFEAQGSLLYLNQTLAELIRLEPTDNYVSVDRVFLDPAPVHFLEAPGQGLYLVLHLKPGQSFVSLLDANNLSPIASLPLSEPFDRLTLSPSGRYLLASFSVAPDSFQGIRNPNQVQVIDLAERRVAKPVLLQTEGLGIADIDFLDDRAGAFADVAIFRANVGLVLLDLAQADSLPLVVRLGNDPTQTATPAQVLSGAFLADGGYLFTRLHESRDVLAIHITRNQGALARSINFLNVPPSGQPMDLAVLADASHFDKVLVVLGGTPGRAAWLDANAIQNDELTFQFEDLATRAIVIRDTDSVSELAVLFHPGSDAQRLFVIDPIGASVQTLAFQDGYQEINAAQNGAFLVASHKQLAGTNQPGVRVIRLEAGHKNRQSTYLLGAKLVGHRFLDEGASILGLLGGETPVAFLLDLDQGTHQDLALDEPARAGGRIPNTHFLYFEGQGPLGSLTFVDDSHMDRSHSLRLDSIAFTSLLDPR